MAPQGEEIASFRSYLDAQKAVDYLSDKAFPVQNVTIVGSDLMMVERVTGRLTYSKVAVAGLASGAWLGLFIGLLFLLFIEDGGPAMISAIAVGAGFGLLFSVISYAMTRGKRDFTSATQIVASRYAVLSLSETAGQAAQLLREGGFLRNEVPLRRSADEASAVPGAASYPAAPAQPLPATHAPAQQPPAQQAPSRPHPNFVDEHGRPRYGVRTEDLQQASDPDAQSMPPTE
ncbi:hypothetical protein GCM10010401_16170 [Rarobacter faecitabidus]